MINNSSVSISTENAISPLDGRNAFKLNNLRKCYSDFILTKHRVGIELDYLVKLSQLKIIKPLNEPQIKQIKKIKDEFDAKEYQKVLAIERKTNHEAKAAEEYVKEKLKKISSIGDMSQMIHFGLTSDDVNNIAYALIIKNILKEIFYPEFEKILKHLKDFSIKYKSLPMLSKTHGQPAAPTALGKEFLIYYKRLDREIRDLKSLNINAKLTGNTGNFNAHQFIYPKVNWIKFSQEFIEAYGLTPDYVTTQIEPYDSLINIFEKILNINNILIGLSIDFWLYIGMGYFHQKMIKLEVGSTALPHKINPIYFEGAEGGFGVANALLEFYIRKLSHSRLQRDLSDSTVRRSFGIAFGYSLLSYQSIIEALSRISPNQEKIIADLNSHYEVLSEAIQNYLRVNGKNDAYDKTKNFFRGKEVDSISIKKFIDSLDLENLHKQKLKELSPEKYTGLAEEIVNKFFKLK